MTRHRYTVEPSDYGHANRFDVWFLDADGIRFNVARTVEPAFDRQLLVIRAHWEGYTIRRAVAGETLRASIVWADGVVDHAALPEVASRL